MKKFLALLAIALQPALALAQNDDMIEIGSITPTATPYVDAQGRAIGVKPVLIRDGANGTVEVAEVTSAFGNPDEIDSYFDAGPVISVNVSRPLGVSVAFGWMFGMIETNGDSWTTDRLGIVVEGEVGTGGGKLAVGPMYEKLIMFLPLGVSAKAAVLRTWGETLGDIDENETYVGGELNAFFLGAKLGIGWYKRISADAGMNPQDSFWLFSGGIGF